MGSPDNLLPLQACSVESAAVHHPTHNVCLAIYVEDPAYNLDSFRRRMKNIPNLKILALDIDLVIQWSPARELWKMLGPDIMSGLWKHVHLSKLIRSEDDDGDQMPTCEHIES